MICFPNCKINIGLRILQKRGDGFHDIQSVFYPVAIHDAIEIIPSKKTTLEVVGDPIRGDLNSNLIYKAWELLHNKYKIDPLAIKLIKRIPSGGGLGGGSADGAFMIKLINDYFNLDFSVKQLEGFAADLGSDCPFFIQNKPAIVSGRGEVISPIDFNLSGYYLLMVSPKIHISTGDAFSLIVPKKRDEISKEILENLPFKDLSKLLYNDFEKPVLDAHPAIKKIKRQLKSMGAFYTSLSGTGSSYYGLFKDKPILGNSLNSFDTWLILL